METKKKAPRKWAEPRFRGFGETELSETDLEMHYPEYQLQMSDLRKSLFIAASQTVLADIYAHKWTSSDTQKAARAAIEYAQTATKFWREQEYDDRD
jgi:hypothetical protein